MYQKRLFHGTNDTQEFWESEDRSAIILRVKGQSEWSAHRNFGFVCFADSAEKAAERLDRSELCRTHTYGSVAVTNLNWSL